MTFENLRQFAKQPKETLKGVPEGIGRFFKRTGRSAKTGLQKLGDVREGNLPGVDPESVSKLPGGSADQQAGPQGSFTENVARAGGDVAVNILGFDKQRRRLAKELGVDPYTTNNLLAARLDEVTWAAFAGGLGVNVLTSLVPGGLILSSSSRLSDWVWDTAPGDLRVQVGETLLSIGVPHDQVDRFLRHSYYTLSMQAVVATSLQSLDSVQGRAVVMAPVDYLSWTATLDAFSANLATSNEGPIALYVSGDISKSARDSLISRTWVVEKPGLITPDAYPLR